MLLIRKENHEKSKKHKENAQALRLAMAEEDILFDDDDLINSDKEKTGKIIRYKSQCIFLCENKIY